MDHYAVFGYPVKHSRSPWIHAQFARQTGQSLRYTAQEVLPDEFENQVLAFFEGGGSGLNITVPFKERAWAMAQECSQTALLAAAVNTLYRNAAGLLCGDNTDGIGMLRDITLNHGGVITDREVLVLGAGGAVRGVLSNLLQEKPRGICIANRTLGKAERLVDQFGAAGNMSACSFSELGDKRFDLIINGTSAGLSGELPPLPDGIVGPDTWCYDMIYGSGYTHFQRWARQQGAVQALDGVGMLVEQAACAFYLWRGVKPVTADVIAGLRLLLAENT